ncbi:MAG: DNA-protecting protein DprA [Candidatus Omnitrophica bacterium]|nr:DNA-protecting protein DprA [Candidatus Omnitrophota bacterium]
MDSKSIKHIAKNLKTYSSANSLDKEIELIEKLGIKVITIDDKEYPSNLKHIYNPPKVLYVKGKIVPKDHYSIAVVGARKSSTYGRETAARLARELAEKSITVVSGMARGIDTYAHRGALESGGRTIAVLGCGINIIYPPENKSLMEEISKSGAVISEFPINTPPLRRNFPMRNRIISGLSFGVVVVEAAEKSGSLITASLALEQGREVFSVPGRVDTRLSRGTLALIKEGAKLVENVDDILEEVKAQGIENLELQLKKT